MNAQDQEILEEIIKKYREKYKRFLEILNLTQELEKALQFNDPNSRQMIMRMRGTEMDAISSIDRDVTYLMHALDRTIQLQLKELPKDQTADDLILLYHDMHGKIRRVAEKVIDLDRKLSEKIAGKDSYYAKQNGVK